MNSLYKNLFMQSPEFLTIIQARMGSKRLPGKSMLDMKGVPLIRRVYASSFAVGGNWPSVVATSNDNTSDVLCEYMDIAKIPYFRGDELDVLSRFVEIVDFVRPKYVIRITGDDPCHMFSMIQKAAEIVTRHNYEYFVSEPSLISNIPQCLPDGLYFEILSSNLIKKISIKFGSLGIVKEHITPLIRENKILCMTGSFHNYELISFNKYKNLKLCVDTHEDYQFLLHNWFNEPDTEVADTMRILKKMYNLTTREQL